MFKENKKAQNAIFLKEVEGKGRKFEARFLEPGLVKYDHGIYLLLKENLENFVYEFVGCPIVLDHLDVTKENAKEVRGGVISDVWFNKSDGWYWCSGIIFDDEIIDKIKNEGYNVSCAYEITDTKVNELCYLHNGIEFDKFIIGGKPEHLAIVKMPRYENALIAVNSLQKSEKQEDYGVTEKQNQLIKECLNNIKGGKMNKEHLFFKVVQAFNSDDKEGKDDEKKVENQDVDKRKLIDEVGGILKGKVDDEIIRTIIGKMEKIAYDKSETGAADNKAKNEDENKDKEKINNKCKNEDEEDKKKEEAENKKVKNEDEYEYEKLKKEVEEEAENKKAKNSIENMFYQGSAKSNFSYISQKQAIELGKQLY